MSNHEMLASANDIRAALGSYHPYSWPLGNKTKENLIDVISPYQNIREIDALYDCLEKYNYDTGCANKQLRNLISPLMRKENAHPLRVNLCLWIIRYWGGIKGGKQDKQIINSWLSELDDFHEDRVIKFAKTNNKKRISSWSKILSFARPDDYAVYDSRTALSLNYALHKIGNDFRFFVPQSRNTRMDKEKVCTLRKPPSNGQYCGYIDYIALLKEMCDSNDPKFDLLGTEMQLFAKAPLLLAKRK